MNVTKLALCERCYHAMIFTSTTYVKKQHSHTLCEKCGKHNIEFIVEITKRD